MFYSLTRSPPPETVDREPPALGGSSHLARTRCAQQYLRPFVRACRTAPKHDADAFEYNRATDEAAAAFVLGDRRLRVTQFPMEIYRALAVSVAELEESLTSAGVLGGWLWQKYLDLGLPPEAGADLELRIEPRSFDIDGGLNARDPSGNPQYFEQ